MSGYESLDRLILHVSPLMHSVPCRAAVKPSTNDKSRMLFAIGLGFLLTVVGFKVVVPDDPYAMLDDTYLNTLKGDDDVANEAAKKVRMYCIH